MANWQSKYICEFGWDFKTSDQPGSGTDSEVRVTLLRDNDAVWEAIVEPGETEALDRGSSGYRYIRFTTPIFVPSEFDTWAAGLEGQPNGIEFPHDIYGHLICQLDIRGDDMWREANISCFVRYCRPVTVPGTIDSMRWQDDVDLTFVGDTSQEFCLSSNSEEGYSSVRMLY